MALNLHIQHRPEWIYVLAISSNHGVLLDDLSRRLRTIGGIEEKDRRVEIVSMPGGSSSAVEWPDAPEAIFTISTTGTVELCRRLTMFEETYQRALQRYFNCLSVAVKLLPNPMVEEVYW